MTEEKKKTIKVNKMVSDEIAREVARNTWESTDAGQEEQRRLKEKRRWTNAKVGDEMSDGTIYAGISPDTRHRMYATPADAPRSMTLREAWDYALDLAHGKDFDLPSVNELAVLFRNREKGALKGTFNLTGANNRADSTGCYWSSSPGSNWVYGQCLNFGDGVRGESGKDVKLSVRCVRSGGERKP